MLPKQESVGPGESLRVNFRSPFSFRLCLPTSSIVYGVADKPKMGYIRPRESLPPWAYLSLEGSVGLAGNEGGSQEFSLGKLEIYVQSFTVMGKKTHLNTLQ